MSGTGRHSGPDSSLRKPPRRVSFFFPVYNDANTIEPLTVALVDTLSKNCDEYEIIIVVDASPDNSGEVADKVATRYSDVVRVIHHPQNRGYGPAVLSGVEAARFDWVAFTDGDMQFDVSEFPLLLKAAESADIVIGYRYKRADTPIRIFFGKSFNFMLRVFLKMPVRDMDCAFKLMNKDIFKDISLSRNYREAFVLVEVFYKAIRRGYSMLQVPVSHHEREFGVSQSFSPGSLIRFIKYTMWGIYCARISRRW